MDINKTAVPAFLAGHGTIGTAAAQAGLSFPAVKGLKIKADAANSNAIYVGHDSNVDATNGYPLAAGEEVTVEVDSLDKVFLVGGAAAQGYAWLAI
jgi:hypothetical protein